MNKTNPITRAAIEKNKVVPIEIDEEQRGLAAALSDVSLALNSSLQLDIVLDRILENLGRVLAYKTANIVLLTGNKARVVRSRGYDLLGTEKVIASKVFDIREIANFQKMVDNKQPVLTYNAHLEQDWQALEESEWIKSHIASPIIIEDTVIGFLNCDSDIAGFYNKFQLSVMQIFATEAGLAIRNARLYDASTKLSQKLRLINDLTHQVLEASSRDEILEVLPEKLMQLSEGNNVYISRWDDEHEIVTGWAATGKHRKQYLQGKSIPGDQTITRHILNANQSTLIADITQTSVMDPKFLTFYQEKTLFCLPLAAENIKLGAIVIGYENIEDFTEDIRAMCEYAAIQISTAMAKIQSLELERIQSGQLTHANALIETLSRVATAFKSGVDSKNIMATMGVELELLHIHSLVALRSLEEESLSLTYSSVQPKIVSFVEKVSGFGMNDLSTPIDILPLFRKIVNEQQAQFIDDPERILKQIAPKAFIPLLKKLADSLLLTQDTRCILVPLIVEKQTIGLLSLWGEDLHKVDIQAASIFGGQVAIAIENANLIQEVQRLAITDELTNVLNRRGFEEVANREFGAAKRYERPLSLIMIDIDRFKAINDVYGHPIGDEILVEIAARARSKIRDTDSISRYGGEEFLILLIEQRPENAKTVAERIRKSIAEHPFATSVGNISVTVSVGLTGANAQTSSIGMMIKTVDKALYKSKENGRNRVTMIDKI